MNEEQRRDALKKIALDVDNNLNIDALLDAFSFLATESSKAKYRGQQRVEAFSERYSELLDEVSKLRLKVSDFETLKTVGRGEFGEVRLCRCKINGECYAMKVLNKCGITRRMDESRFWEERDVMARVESDFIVKMNYAFQDEVNLYIVMDFMPGGDLWQMLIDTAEDWNEDWTRFYMAELLIAIDDMHQNGYVHRDVKPENIMVDIEGHFRLTDFGSAGKIPENGILEKTSVAVGTPTYVAPEVLKTEPYTKSCDLFSFGCVLFETIMGASPFENEEGGSIFESNEKTIKLQYELPPADDELIYSDSYGDLIKKLLVHKDERLTMEEVKAHEFFKGIDWEKMKKKEVKTPYTPKVTGMYDADTYFNDVESDYDTIDKFVPGSEFAVDHLPFIGFSYNKYHHWGDVGGKEQTKIVAPAKSSGGAGDPELIEKFEREIRELKSNISEEQQKAQSSKRDAMQALSKLQLAEAECKSLESKFNSTNRKMERMQKLRRHGIEEQNTQLADLEKKVAESELNLRTALTKVKKSVEVQDEFERKIQGLEAALAKERELRKDLESKSASSKDLGGAVADLEKQLASSKEGYDTLNARNAELEKNEEMINLEMSELSKKVDSLKSANKELEEAKATVVTNLEKMEENLESLKHDQQSSAEKSSTKLVALQTKIEELEAVIVKNKTYISEIESEKSQLEQQTAKLSSELEYAKEKQNALSASVNENQKEIQNQDLQRQQRIEEMESQLSNIRAEKAASDSESAQLKRKLDELCEEAKKMEGDLGERATEINSLNEKLEELGNDNQQQKRNLTARTIEVTSLKSKIAKATTDIQAAIEEKEDVVKSNKVLEMTLKQEKESVVNLQASIDTLKAKMKELDDDIADKVSTIASLDTENKEMEEEFLTEVKNLKAIQVELRTKMDDQAADADKEYSMLDLSKKEVERNFAISEENNKELKEELEQIQEELESKKVTISTLSEERDKINEENNNLLNTLKEKERRLAEEEQEKDIFQRQVYVTQTKLQQTVIKFEQFANAKTPDNPNPRTDRRAVKMIENKYHNEVAANKRLLEENQQLKSKIELENFNVEELERMKVEVEKIRSQNKELQHKVSHLQMMGGGKGGQLQGYLKVPIKLKRRELKKVYAVVNAEQKKIFFFNEEPKSSNDKAYLTITIGHVFHARPVTSAEVVNVKSNELDHYFQVIYAREAGSDITSTNTSGSEPGVYFANGHSLVEGTNKGMILCEPCGNRIIIFNKYYKCKDCDVKCHATTQCAQKLKPCFGGIAGQSLLLKAANGQEKAIWVETLTKIKTEALTAPASSSAVAS